MKQCKTCNETKPLDDFPKSKNRPDGRHPYCSVCTNAKHRKIYHDSDGTRKEKLQQFKKAGIAKKRDYVYDILKQSKCIDCGDARWQVLEFDHVRGEKLHGVCDMIRGNMSITNIQTEIDKCEIRCANCHRLKTAVQFGWTKGKE